MACCSYNSLSTLKVLRAINNYFLLTILIQSTMLYLHNIACGTEGFTVLHKVVAKVLNKS